MPALLVLVLALTPLAPRPDEPAPVVRSVCDLSQEFTFYMDGRFARQYLDGRGVDARNWGSLHRLDLDGTNLLVLVGGDPRLPYTDAAVDHVQAYLRDGGAVLVMADGAPGDAMPPVERLVERFDGRLDVTRAEPPLVPTGALTAVCGVEAFTDGAVFRGGACLDLGPAWQPLLVDARERVVLAGRDVGAGRLLLGSRGLFGQRPDASDPINAPWVTPLLVDAASRRQVDPDRPHPSTWAEHERQVGPLTLEYHDGTAPFAQALADEYAAARPELVAITGVEPSPGMIKRLLVLPTGGGGFSSGARIAIGAWWGGYPGSRYGMVELIGHEAGHSWVLPHAEPLWNEPIATWLGVQVGRRLGLPEADAALARQLARDDFPADADPLAADAPRDLVWGRSFAVFEALEGRFGPGAMAKYFRTKRRVLAPDRPAYGFDDCVAVWSLAVGEDLFGWFAERGFDVDRTRTDLPAPDGVR